MRLLYIAEIVGKPGIHCVRTALPKLRQDRAIDFVIANGDGATGGFGIGKNHAIQLRKLGVDVITGGDQTFFKKDMAEHIDKVHYVLRPANLPPELPGRGWRHYTVTSNAGRGPDSAAGRPEAPNGEGVAEAANDAATESAAAAGGDGSVDVPSATEAGDGAPAAVRIAVVSLLGQSGYDRMHGGNPFTYLANVSERLNKDSAAVVVDFHALTTAEKYTMFHHADGMVTAVIGSGQRVQTSDAHVLTRGTGVICDAGRTGSQNSVSGFVPEPEIRKYLTRMPAKSLESWERLELQGLLLELDLATGYLLGVEPVRVPVEAPNRSRSDGSDSTAE